MRWLMPPPFPAPFSHPLSFAVANKEACMSTVAVRRQGSVAEVVLDRPAVHNAFDDTLIAELTAALREVEADTAVRTVVLSGSGSTFSAGADLNWMRGMAAASEADNRADSARLAT